MKHPSSSGACPVRRTRIAGAAGLAAGILAAGFVLAGAASAHVTVTAPGATSGGSDQEITFRVPVEKDVNSVGLQVALPTNTPIASVLVLPVPGWTSTEKSVKLAEPIVTDDGDITEAVSEITWTATGGGLKPGQFGEFTIIAGRLPDAKSLTFPAVQTYADGSTVDWNQVAAPGSTAEPDNPAPVLDLAAARDASGSAAPSSPASAVAAAGANGGSSSNWPGVVGMIAGILALLISIAVLLLTRARAARSTTSA